MPCWGLKNYVSESWGTQKRTQKTFKPTLFVPFRRTQKFHHNEARAFLGFFSFVVELNYCNNSKRKRKKEKEKGGGGD
jgi:hypothetical protein